MKEDIIEKPIDQISLSTLVPVTKIMKDDVYHYSKQEENSSDIRAVSTLIYYLLDSDQFSAFHKVRFDEIWHFYKGSSVSLYVLSDSEKL